MSVCIAAHFWVDMKAVCTFLCVIPSTSNHLPSVTASPFCHCLLVKHKSMQMYGTLAQFAPLYTAYGPNRCYRPCLLRPCTSEDGDYKQRL